MSEPRESFRDCETLRRELEDRLLLLKTTTDPQAQKWLLSELRLMLELADQLISSEQ